MVMIIIVVLCKEKKPRGNINVFKKNHTENVAFD